MKTDLTEFYTRFNQLFKNYPKSYDVTATGDGHTKIFSIPYMPMVIEEAPIVTVASVIQTENTDYICHYSSGYIEFITAPVDAAAIEIKGFWQKFNLDEIKAAINRQLPRLYKLSAVVDIYTVDTTDFTIDNPFNEDTIDMDEFPYYMIQIRRIYKDTNYDKDNIYHFKQVGRKIHFIEEKLVCPFYMEGIKYPNEVEDLNDEFDVPDILMYGTLVNMVAEELYSARLQAFEEVNTNVIKTTQIELQNTIKSLQFSIQKDLQLYSEGEGMVMSLKDM